MQFYAAGEYANAARRLDSIMTEDPTTTTAFFLGVSLLKSGNVPQAAERFTAVAQDSTSPYSAEAALWLAKAWLGAGLPDSAAQVLTALGRRSDHPAIAGHARALADSLRKVRFR